MVVADVAGHVSFSLQVDGQAELMSVRGIWYFFPSCGRRVNGVAEAEAWMHLELLRWPLIQLHGVLDVRNVRRRFLGRWLG